MTESVEEIYEFVRSGTFLAGSPRLDSRWSITTDREAAAVNSEDWADLREEVASEIFGRPLSPEVKARFRSSVDEVGQTLLRRFRRSQPWLIDDAAGDLLNAARARLTGEPSEFFETLFDVYRAGWVPVGWEGDFPEGRLLVLALD